MADLGKVRDALDVVTIERLLTDGDLEPVILRRIVAAGDHDPAVHVKSKQGIVEGRRGHDTDVDDIGTLARHTIDKRISKVLAAGPHVTADRKRRRARASPLSHKVNVRLSDTCLLYTSDAADDLLCVDLGGRRIIKKKKKKTRQK